MIYTNQKQFYCERKLKKFDECTTQMQFLVGLICSLVVESSGKLLYFV